MLTRTRLVPIGNSQGIRIPKIVLEHLGLTDEIELEVQGNQLVVRAARSPRAGWAEAFQKMAEKGDDKMLDDEYIPTIWEETEWEW